MKNTNNKPVVVMPAIYHLPGLSDPKAREWGWHKATELLASVQSIIYLRDGRSLTAYEICVEYPQNPSKNRVFYNANKEGTDLSILVFADDFVSPKWLQKLVDTNTFLPARIGMHLIQAVKRQTVKAIEMPAKAT